MKFIQSIVLGACLVCPTVSGAVTISATITGEIASTNWDLSNPVLEAGSGGPSFEAGDGFAFDFDFDTAAKPKSFNVLSANQARTVWDNLTGSFTLGGETHDVDVVFQADFFRTNTASNDYRLDTYVAFEKPITSGPQAGWYDAAVPFFFESVTYSGDPSDFDPLYQIDNVALSAPVFPLDVSEVFANVFCNVCTPDDFVSFDAELSNLSLTETNRVQAVPLPAPFMLLLVGLAGLGAVASRRKSA